MGDWHCGDAVPCPKAALYSPTTSAPTGPSLPWLVKLAPWVRWRGGSEGL